MNRYLILLFVVFCSIGCSSQIEQASNKDILNNEQEIIETIVAYEIDSQKFPTDNMDFILKDTLQLRNDYFQISEHLSDLSTNAKYKRLFGKINSDFEKALIDLAEVNNSPRTLDSTITPQLQNVHLSLYSTLDKNNRNKSKVVFSFSRVSFNKDLSRACIYGEWTMSVPFTSFVNTTGKLYLLEFRDKKWVITDTTHVWSAS